MRLHSIPESIVLDHDTEFISTFRCELNQLMGTKLLMSTAFHLRIISVHPHILNQVEDLDLLPQNGYAPIMSSLVPLGIIGGVC